MSFKGLWKFPQSTLSRNCFAWGRSCFVLWNHWYFLFVLGRSTNWFKLSVSPRLLQPLVFGKTSLLWTLERSLPFCDVDNQKECALSVSLWVSTNLWNQYAGNWNISSSFTCTPSRAECWFDFFLFGGRWSGCSGLLLAQTTKAGNPCIYLTETFARMLFANSTVLDLTASGNCGLVPRTGLRPLWMEGLWGMLSSILAGWNPCIARRS